MRADHATGAPPRALGFRVVGDHRNERRLVDWTTALVAHAACDPRAEVDSECYLSAFAFGDEFRNYLATNGTTRGYAGPVARCGCGSTWTTPTTPGAPWTLLGG